MTDPYMTALSPGQSAPIPGKPMVENNAGGYVFKLDPIAELRRALILGARGGTFYESESDIAGRAARLVAECASAHPADTVAEILAVSTGRLAKSNRPAVFALAVCASVPAARPAALDAVTQVCRTPTDLFQFLEYAKALGLGWGRAFTRAVQSYYTDTPVDRLALHAVKYRQRNGWTHRDALRKTHPKPTADRAGLFEWITKGSTEADTPPIIRGYEAVTATKSKAEAAALITEFSLPWETVPGDLRTDPGVWRALIPHMGMNALVRQLSTLARIGFLKPLSSDLDMVVDRLTDPDSISGSRLHPVAFIDAMLAHKSGGTAGLSRGATYPPSSAVVGALDKAAVVAFENIEPADRRMYLALDVSSSMLAGPCGGSIMMSPRVGSAVMALATVKTEPKTHVAGFTSTTRQASMSIVGGRSVPTGIMDLSISARDTIESAIRKVSGLPFGGTDCALPMLDAAERELEVDCFVVYTDSETWAGRVHPVEALNAYRQKSGIDARLVVVGMTATEFTIADPGDAGMLDLVGFDASAPRLLSEFAAGRL